MFIHNFTFRLVLAFLGYPRISYCVWNLPTCMHSLVSSHSISPKSFWLLSVVRVSVVRIYLAVLKTHPCSNWYFGLHLLDSSSCLHFWVSQDWNQILRCDNNRDQQKGLNWDDFKRITKKGSICNAIKRQKSTVRCQLGTIHSLQQGDETLRLQLKCSKHVKLTGNWSDTRK